MKNCPNCRTNYPEDKKFCKTCGSSLIEGSVIEFSESDTIYKDNKSDLSKYLNMIPKDTRDYMEQKRFS